MVHVRNVDIDTEGGGARRFADAVDARQFLADVPELGVRFQGCVLRQGPLGGRRNEGPVGMTLAARHHVAVVRRDLAWRDAQLPSGGQNDGLSGVRPHLPQLQEMPHDRGAPTGTLHAHRRIGVVRMHARELDEELRRVDIELFTDQCRQSPS